MNQDAEESVELTGPLDTSGAAWGMVCWQAPECREEITVGYAHGDPVRAVAETGRKAREAGWMMGLTSDAQGAYSCPGCAPGLFRATPFR